jgi:hypothetical protein
MERIASVAMGGTTVLVIDRLAMEATLPFIGAKAWLVATKSENPTAYIILTNNVQKKDPVGKLLMIQLAYMQRR